MAIDTPASLTRRTPGGYSMFTLIVDQPETLMPLGPASQDADFTVDELIEIHHLPRHRVLQVLMCHDCKEIAAILAPDPGPLKDMMKERGVSNYAELSDEDKEKHRSWQAEELWPLFEDDGTEYQDPNDERTGGFVAFDETRENPISVELAGPDIAPGVPDEGEINCFTLDPTDAVLLAEKILAFFAPYKLTDGMQETAHDGATKHGKTNTTNKAAMQRMSSTRH